MAPRKAPAEMIGPTVSRAIFVHLKETYPQLTPETQADRHAWALRNCTCVSWFVNPKTAGDIRYAFGVYQGHIVSGYAVDVPVMKWPRLPPRSLGAGRRYIPAADLPEQVWRLVQRQDLYVEMQGPIRYGDVSDDGNFTVTLSEAEE